jgi:hypothetical protein
MYTCSLSSVLPFSLILFHTALPLEKKQLPNNAAVAKQNNALVVIFAVTRAVVLILQEEVLVAAVSGKRNGGDSQTGETASESVPAGKGALVSPCLAIWIIHSLALLFVASCCHLCSLIGAI